MDFHVFPVFSPVLIFRLPAHGLLDACLRGAGELPKLAIEAFS